MPNCTVPGMPHVPLDVVYGILSKCESKQDLISASLVNKDFARASRPALFNRIVINLSRLTACFSLLDALTTYDDIRLNVREIEVVGAFMPSRHRQRESGSGRWIGPEGESSEDVERLMKALANATLEGFGGMQLTAVRWIADVDIPSNFMQALAKTFSACSLMIGCYAGAPLPPSPNLISLSAVVHMDSDPLPEFQPILLQSPNLRSLELQAYQQTGCVVEIYSAPEFLKYDPTASPKLPGCPPLLEELKIKDMRFSVAGVSTALKIYDWSRLRVLSVSGGWQSLPLLRALVPAMSRIPALEDFSFSSWWFSGGSEKRTAYSNAIRDVLLSTASGLLVIDLEGPFTTLASDIAEHHGHSLLRLRLHHPESTEEDEKVLLYIGELEKMGSKCLKLEELCIDVATDFSLSKSHDTRCGGVAEVVHSEAYFPHLHTLSLHAELGIRHMALAHSARSEGQYQSRDPFQECKAIVPRLLCSRAKPRWLQIYVGECREMDGGYPASWDIWEHDHQFHLQLERIDGDEHVAMKATGGPHDLMMRDSETTGAWTIDHSYSWTIDPTGTLNIYHRSQSVARYDRRSRQKLAAELFNDLLRKHSDKGHISVGASNDD